MKDKRNFFIIGRASALEYIAIMDVIEDLELLSPENAERYRVRYEQISKMIFGVIRGIERRI